MPYEGVRFKPNKNKNKKKQQKGKLHFIAFKINPKLFYDS